MEQTVNPIDVRITENVRAAVCTLLANAAAESELYQDEDGEQPEEWICCGLGHMEIEIIEEIIGREQIEHIYIYGKL